MLFIRLFFLLLPRQCFNLMPKNMRKVRMTLRKLGVLVAGCLMATMAGAQTVDADMPWSVRMTRSEMIRNPESWQLDFQTKLKWDYCLGLELGAMLDVYDRYGCDGI